MRESVSVALVNTFPRSISPFSEEGSSSEKMLTVKCSFFHLLRYQSEKDQNYQLDQEAREKTETTYFLSFG